MKPLVSIIIPVYNGANYLREAIDSALAQTYENIEILVINDGSKDDGKTEQIALSYGDKIRYIAKENGGSSSALNVGIKNMKGEFFSWLSHDDLYLPEKIEKQMIVMQELNGFNSIVVCEGTLIDKNGDVILYKSTKRQGMVFPKNVLAMLSHGKGINGCGVLVSKAILDQVGFFDENMVYLNDLDYWWRLILHNTNVFFMRDKLVKTRIHSNQVSVTKKEMFNKERHYLANKLLDDVNGIEIEMHDALKQIAYFCATENLNDEYNRVKKILYEDGYLSVGISLYLSMVWIKGSIKRLLKWIRKKVFFPR